MYTCFTLDVVLNIKDFLPNTQKYSYAQKISQSKKVCLLGEAEKSIFFSGPAPKALPPPPIVL